MNVLTFTGNIGQDYKQTTTQNGMAVCQISVAMASGYGENKKTTWVSCVMFGKLAESGIVQYLLKGQQVAVTGEAELQEWQNSQGESKASLKCVVSKIDLLGQRQQSQQGGYQQASQARQQPQPKQQPSAPQPAQSSGFDDFDSDIPF